MFFLKSNNEARIVCVDFEESLRLKNNWIDGLDVSEKYRQCVALLNSNV